MRLKKSWTPAWQMVSLETVAGQPTVRRTICSLVWFTVFSVCENAVMEFFTFCNMPWKHHQSEVHVGTVRLMWVLISHCDKATEIKVATWWSLRWFLRGAWKSAHQSSFSSVWRTFYNNTCNSAVEVLGKKTRENSADRTVTSAAQKELRGRERFNGCYCWNWVDLFRASQKFH